MTPSVPTWAEPDMIAASLYKEKGTIMHSSEYRSCKDWSGQRGVVVGTANTAHDVAEDMANANMYTTMMQRGHTFVLPAEWLHHALDMHYNDHMHPTHADKETCTYPYKIQREMMNRTIFALIKNNPERFDDLEKSGFRLERYGDTYTNLYIRYGGHYVDSGASKRIVEREIQVETTQIKGLVEEGLLLKDGRMIPANLIVLATGFNHDFRRDAARLLGQDVANQMDE
ncbi:hypothetical protein LTR86_011331, partial [Recurvomyces mirabilis]